MKKLVRAAFLKFLSLGRVRTFIEWNTNIGSGGMSRDPDKYLTPVRVPIGEKTISFYPFGAVPVWRYQTLFTKEPETIEWIDGFSAGDVFWDVGANVGVYSLYAAAKRNARVLSFEPSAVNYFILNRNIQLNKLDEQISAFPAAFSDHTGVGHFNMHSTAPGEALFHFGEKRDQITAGEHTVHVQYLQAMIGYTIDQFMEMFKTPFPNYLKIDVDGIEEEIILGAPKTLADKRLKSVMIELDDLNPGQRDRITDLLQKAGFKLGYRKHSEMFNTGKFASLFNHFFFR